MVDSVDHEISRGPKVLAAVNVLSIRDLAVEHLTSECVTDVTNPRISFHLESDRQDAALSRAVVTVGEWKTEMRSLPMVRYSGPPLQPFTVYNVHVVAEDDSGETAEARVEFETGRMDEQWQADWITDGTYRFRKRKVSPKPLTFRKQFRCGKEIQSARLYGTALGVYELMLNGSKVGRDYFAPGFTSYRHQLQYQTYDITEQLGEVNELLSVIAGGWAVGSFTYARRNRVYAKRQALLVELRIEYTDGSQETIGTDETWQVTREGNYLEAEFYNGEVYDATVNLEESFGRNAATENVRIRPEILAQYGAPVRTHETLSPVEVIRTPSGMTVYDFGQNLAGVIAARISGKKGQTVCFRHAEVMMGGELFTKPLRTARQEAVYICSDGDQIYSPRLTYMGFRYVGVTGISEGDLELTAVALYSDGAESGGFSCSNKMLNKLQSNIRWGAKSNFVDIPTDCPQRDERMGWTGDIALFASTAVYNFNLMRFLEKWLRDLRSEQSRGGGFPVTVPLVRVPTQWEIMIPMAVDHWGDAGILVPWAMYLCGGDPGTLEQMYPAMKRYIKACVFWAGLFSFGKRRRIWRLLHHYGDWVAPNTGLWGWMSRGKWTGTASLARSCSIVAQIAEILGRPEDADHYRTLSREASEAYRSILMDRECRATREFQTAYVLPLHYEMLSGKDRQKAAGHLARIVRENNHNIGTGFPGTPYVLFALADNGYVQDAYRMLLNETCPSWLFQVKVGGTTVWERWDALREDGTSNTGESDGTGGMVSFNHFAGGAVGDFLYRRIAGIESLEGGYKSFRIAPVPGGGLTWAEGWVTTAYGRVSSYWKIEDDLLSVELEVPVGTSCELALPGSRPRTLGAGKHAFKVEYVQ